MTFNRFLVLLFKKNETSYLQICYLNILNEATIISRDNIFLMENLWLFWPYIVHVFQMTIISNVLMLLKIFSLI